MASKQSQVAVVVGVEHNQEQFRVIVANISTTNDDRVYNWQFNCKVMSKDEVKKSISLGAKWLNIKLENDKIKGSAGSLQRFETLHHPLVIISQLIDNTDKLLGFKVATYDGKVKNISLKELVAYGNRVSKSGGVPIQNAIFVPEDSNKKAYYKAYPNCPFITEVIISKKSAVATKINRVPLQKNERTLNKLEEIYTPEQIAELREGKNNGVEIRIYANPQLSPQQMRALRKGLQDGVNVKPFASPEYSPELMRWYSDDSKAGIDIRKYLNPKYSIGQLSEISIAAEEGLDLSILADIKKSPNDMAEIRERLEKKIWKEEFVKKDGSWT